jgi:hypothetical protein
MTVFYCLRFETSPAWRARSHINIPQEQSGPVTPPGTGLSFLHLLRLTGLRWRYSNPPPQLTLVTDRTKTPLPTALLLLRACLLRPLPSNGRRLQSHSLAVTIVLLFISPSLSRNMSTGHNILWYNFGECFVLLNIDRADWGVTCVGKVLHSNPGWSICFPDWRCS